MSNETGQLRDPVRTGSIGIVGGEELVELVPDVLFASAEVTQVEMVRLVSAFRVGSANRSGSPAYSCR